jgi:hypothetical protein
MYTLKANEKALGYNVLTDLARNNEAFKAIEKRVVFYCAISIAARRVGNSRRQVTLLY